jgi:hypothetical protein
MPYPARNVLLSTQPFGTTSACRSGRTTWPPRKQAIRCDRNCQTAAAIRPFCRRQQQAQSEGKRQRPPVVTPSFFNSSKSAFRGCSPTLTRSEIVLRTNYSLVGFKCRSWTISRSRQLMLSINLCLAARIPKSSATITYGRPYRGHSVEFHQRLSDSRGLCSLLSAAQREHESHRG